MRLHKKRYTKKERKSVGLTLERAASEKHKFIARIFVPIFTKIEFDLKKSAGACLGDVARNLILFLKKCFKRAPRDSWDT